MGKRRGLSTAQEATIAAAYAFPKGIAMLFVGFFSDRFLAIGRKPLIVIGFLCIALGLVVTAVAAARQQNPEWVFGFVLSGAIAIGGGTGTVYPIMSAAITDHVTPCTRATALGTYRFWRDLGYAVGALMTGAIADSGDSFLMATIAVVIFVVATIINVQINYKEGGAPAAFSKRGDRHRAAEMTFNPYLVHGIDITRSHYKTSNDTAAVT